MLVSGSSFTSSPPSLDASPASIGTTTTSVVTSGAPPSIETSPLSARPQAHTSDAIATTVPRRMHNHTARVARAFVAFLTILHGPRRPVGPKV
jgi:hypothetical protein